jgi:hypothetical protein
LIASPDDRTIEYLRGFGYQYFAFKQGKFIPGMNGELNTFFMTAKKSSLVSKNMESTLAALS